MFKKWLVLTEGRYDQATTIISRSIINAVKSSPLNKTQIFFYGNPNDLRGLINYPDALSKLNNLEGIKKNIILALIPSSVSRIGGSYRPKRNLITIELSVNPKTLQQEMQKIIETLKNTIRHELEHSGQDNELLDKYNQSQDDVWESQESVINYFTSPPEIAAHVSGIYKQAKTSRTSFTQKLEEYLEKIKNKLLDVGMPNIVNILNIIKTKWLDYANQRFLVK